MRPILICLTAGFLIAATAAVAASAERSDLRPSIGRALPLLDRAEFGFEKQAQCPSCHTQIDPLVAAKVARDHGVSVNETVFQRQRGSMAEALRSQRSNMLNGVGIGGATAVISAITTGLADADFPADEATDAAAAYLLSKQSQDGSWPAVAVRYPHGEDAFDVTARGIRSLQAYAPPALRPQADAAVARARAWMIATPAGAANQSYANRLQGLVWAKAPVREVERARAQLSARQNKDGGWSQKPGMESDAFATAGDLIALAQSGMKPSDPVYQRGLDYLVRTQKPDGSWYVLSRALPIQPPIDSGFPYGRDQWISTWATAYAVQAMAYAL